MFGAYMPPVLSFEMGIFFCVIRQAFLWHWFVSQFLFSKLLILFLDHVPEVFF